MYVGVDFKCKHSLSSLIHSGSHQIEINIYFNCKKCRFLLSIMNYKLNDIFCIYILSTIFFHSTFHCNIVPAVHSNRLHLIGQLLMVNYFSVVANCQLFLSHRPRICFSISAIFNFTQRSTAKLKMCPHCSNFV